ncbi:glutathione S-transferase [Lentibacter sp.]|uniref:glutathione S-transferase n=1 Tax=Lentibacter sp. TaxID=2024994 RepID=UPI003F6AF532
MTQTPVLWSFRRCPYAMRARLALASAAQPVALREIVLRDKPEAFLAASPSGTVPCLDLGTSQIDESLDIMIWALEQSDPEGLLNMPAEGHPLIAACDGPFKAALDRTKYATRYEGSDTEAERAKASAFIARLEAQLGDKPGLFGARPTLADLAILPFVRQFAHIDQAWFAAQPWPAVQSWLAAFKASPRFETIMQKYPPWQSPEAGHPFPES